MNPGSGTRTSAYDNNGNLTHWTNALGTARITYDILNRVMAKSYSSAAITPSVTYTSAGPSQRQDFLASVSSNVATYAYASYDAVGRPHGGTQTVGGQSWTFPAMAWTPGGQVASLTYPSGRVVNTAFDSAGRVAGVSGVSGSGAVTAYVAAGSVSYAAHGGLASYRLGDNITRTVGYDTRLEPSSIAAGSLMTLGLSWNANGNLGSQHITRGGLDSWQTYAYDGVNRLKSALEGNHWNQWYAYDDAGNRAVVSNNSGQNSSIAGSVYMTPQVATQTAGAVAAVFGGNRWNGASYDGAGNVTAAGSQTMGYDMESRMVALSEPGTNVFFGYDGDGRRVWKQDGAEIVTYVYDPAGNVAVEAGTTTGVVSGPVYLTRDHLGSVRLVTNGVGGCVGAHDYLPYGEEVPSVWGRAGVSCYGAVDTDVKFTGQFRDADSGLDYFGARYLSGSMGRFTSPDPLGNFVASVGNPQSWNLYSYGQNGPMNYVDPSGLCSVKAGAAAATDDPNSPCVDPGGTSVTVVAPGPPPLPFDDCPLCESIARGLGGGQRAGNADGAGGQGSATSGSGITKQQGACIADAVLNGAAGAVILGYAGAKTLASLVGVNVNLVQGLLGYTPFVTAGSPTIAQGVAGFASGYSMYTDAVYEAAGGAFALSRANALVGRAGFALKSASAQAGLLNNVSRLSSLEGAAGFAKGLGGVTSVISAGFDIYNCVKK